MTAALIDQDARDAIATDLGATLFVEASAGSGKTTQLVARLLALLVTGRARVDQVAAITFTEAAAGELRDRLAGALEAEASGTGARAEAAADALDGLDGAAITTLHGFARRLLAEHPFAAGLPPVFEVLDQVRSVVDLAERWPGMLDRLLDDPDDAQAVQWGLACGVTLDDLRTIAAGLDASWDRVTEDVALDPPPVVGHDVVLEPVRAALAMAPECTDPDDNLLAHLRSLEPWAERLADSTDDVEVLGVLSRRRQRITTTRGRSTAWQGRKPEVVGLLDRAQAERDRVVADTAAFVLRRLGHSLGAMVRAAAATRRREGRLYFHDLLVLARDLVRDDRDAQAAIHDQYRYVLIDEFQDTDPLQADLAARIASPAPAGLGRRWQDLEVAAGRIFYVGDPKQSIYRFRGADGRLFEEVKSLLPPSCFRALTTNFRSTPGIVDWVDAVFSDLVPDGGPPHVGSVPARGAHDGGHGPPVVVLGADEEPPATANEARVIEAAQVAAVVLAARDERWPVGDGSRSATLADVAVLVRTRGAVPALEEAFDRAGIPYRLESSSLVYEAPEVHDLLSILHAVDDPTDQASVVAALRTAGFACGDDDLLRHHQAGGSWDYRTEAPVAGPVADGFAALRELHDARWWLEVSAMVARVIEERRLLPLCLDGPRWREAWRRLRYVLDQARQFTEGSPGDLREFLAWVDVQRAEDARATEIVLPEGDVDAVRVMTVHAAKGLEFPVVVVAGFGSEPQRRGPGVLFGPDGPELAARRELATPGYRPLADAEHALDDAERVRLLYVAATRARDHLVVSVHRGARAGGGIAARLAAACGACDGLWRPHVGPAADTSTVAGPAAAPRPAAAPSPAAAPRPAAAPSPAAAPGPAAAPRPAAAPVVDDERSRAAWLASRDRRMDEAHVPGAVAATGVARLAGETRLTGVPAAIEEEDADRPSWRRGRAGTSVGRAVHRVLQTVDLATGAGLDRLAAAEADIEGVPGRADEVAALARVALEAPLVRAAVAGGRYWRELYVGTSLGGRVLEGIVDLLVDGPGGLAVVDYKTDQATDLDRALAGHRLQGAAYALAVSRAVGRPVARCTFLFLRAGGAVARDVVDLEAAMREVEGAVTGLS